MKGVNLLVKKWWQPIQHCHVGLVIIHIHFNITTAHKRKTKHLIINKIDLYHREFLDKRVKTVLKFINILFIYNINTYENRVRSKIIRCISLLDNKQDFVT